MDNIFVQNIKSCETIKLVDKNMDYLDPQKKRNHKVRLLIGYGLFAVAISIATVLLVYIANGYIIDKSTGEVIQNGLVFVDSKPNGANVVLNGEQQRGKTDVRLVIPEGAYTVDVDLEGYESWTRSFLLDGASLRRLTYARLFPTELETTPVLDLTSDVSDISQSIDKRWLAVSHSVSPLSLSLIDIDRTVPTIVSLKIPETLVSSLVNGRVKFIEWTADNKSVLVKYNSDSEVAYLLINREDPSLSQNLNTLLDDSSAVVSLLDRKNDQFFAFNATEKALYTATATAGIAAEPVATSVLAYKTFGADWILYVTESGKKDLAEVRFKRGDKDILLHEIQADNSYLLQLAKLGSAPVMAVSSPIENRAIVYSDPQDYLNNNPDARIPVATAVVRVTSPIGLTISSDSSVVLGYGMDNFASYEFNDEKSYNYKTESNIDIGNEVHWMDGQHIVFSSEGIQHVVDFDGSNEVKLVSSVGSIGSFYNDAISQMFTVSPSVAATESTLAIPSKVHATELLIPADR
ncbi:MAG: hypothetical protein ACI9T8_000089 [Candidatus Saccharimonadales bacterium]|jgi:hypothetical protein